MNIYYTVKASYAGGPTEVVETGLDYTEALIAVREKHTERGWVAWLEEDRDEGYTEGGA